MQRSKGINISRLEARFRFYRLLMKGKFDVTPAFKGKTNFLISNFAVCNFYKRLYTRDLSEVSFKKLLSKVISFFLWTRGNEHLDAQQSFRLKCAFPFYIVLHSVGQKPFFKLCGHLIYPIMCRDLSINWSIGFIKEYANL